MPHFIDITVGNRVRELRIRYGLSQQDLGAAIGVSFQQVQKYERGQNRMGASRLTMIADALKVSPGSLLKGLGKFDDAKFGVDAAPLNVKASKVARDWKRINDERLRTKTAEMLRSLSQRRS